MKLLVGICVFLLVPLCWGQDILFEDDFDDGDADGWYEATDAVYEVNEDFRYEFSYYEEGEPWGIAYRGDGGEVMSRRDYSVVVEAIAHDSTTRINLDVRLNPYGWIGYSLGLNYSHGTYYVGRWDSFTDWTTLGWKTYEGGLEMDTAYWMRFECHVDTLRGKVWEGGPSQEPDEWMIEAYDDTYYTYGCVGLEAYNTEGDYFNAEFDNIVVTDPWVGLEPETWAGIKASFGQ